jgi:hypothetical protein
MAKKAKTKTKLPHGSKHTEGGVTSNALGGVADRVKAVAAKVEAMVGDASAKGRERIKPVVEKIRAKWHEMKGVEPADDSLKKLATPVTAAKGGAPKKAKKKKAAKPVKKAAQAKGASTRQAKRPNKGVKKKA